ncbi:MAG: O-antigen ligase family protein [Rhodothermaceae bacterium]|nr:O-antigen ligase family protein [Rhodothermaceae bacterium]
MPSLASLSDDALRRWGEGTLIAILAGSLVVTGVVIWRVPDAAPLLPLGLLAILGAGMLFRHPRLNFILWLGGLALLLSSDEGIQLHEALYGLYFYGYLMYWYGRRVLLYRSRFVRGLEDQTALLLIVFGLLGGIALGLLFGADPMRLRGETLAFSLLALYFPVKEFVVREKKGPLIVLGLITWIGLYVTVDNALYTQRAFAEATAVWEIADVRIAGRELLLVFSALLLLALTSTVRGAKHTLVTMSLLAIVLAGLILTKSRAFWVAFLLGAAVLMLLVRGDDRRRLLLRSAGGALAFLVVAYILIGPYLYLMVSGILNRFATLSAATTDISLVNRIEEAKAVAARARLNPVLGYGFGTTYSFFNLTYWLTDTKSYIHNGYIAVWYKLGLWGVVLIGLLWGSVLRQALRLCRQVTLPPFYRALASGTAACLLCLVLPVYTTSVFFEDEKLSAFALVAALTMGIAQRFEKQSQRLPEKLSSVASSPRHL